MPQPVIVRLPCGQVPVYALRLVEALKEKGITQARISVGSLTPQPLKGFPSHWNPPSTRDSKQFDEDGVGEFEPKDALLIQLGTTTNPTPVDCPEVRISCSLFRDASGPCFPEVILAMLKDDGYIEVTASSTSTASANPSELKGFFKIIPHSYEQSVELALDGAIGLLIRMVVSIHSGLALFPPGPTARSNDMNGEKTTAASIYKLRKKVGLAGIRKRFQQSFTLQRWNIGIIDAPIHEVALSSNKNWRVTWLKEGQGTGFRADPFGIIHAKGKHILFECMHNDRGRIHSIDEKMRETVLLEDESHYSYPYTFESEGVTYVVPESSENQCLRIFPIEKDNLLIGNPIELRLGLAAVDPSIVRYNNRWWLFFTDKSLKGADLRLHVFFADLLGGPWEPHPMNPVKTDIRSARPAGHLFVHNGILYRPSQDSSRTYGGRIIINRIDELDPTRFREIPVNRLEPENFNGPYQSGIHTISALGNQTCIDGKRNVFHPFAFQRFFS